MEKLDWNKLQRSSQFWKPDIDVQYLVELTDWSIQEKQFADGTNTVLTFKVMNVTKDADLSEQTAYFHPPKEFSTSSMSFVNGIRNIIDTACEHDRKSILIFLRKTGEGKKTMYSVNDAGMMKKFRNKEVKA